MKNSYSINGRGAYQTRNTQLANLVESNLELVESLAEKMMNRNLHRSSLTES